MDSACNWFFDIGNTRLKWARADALDAGDVRAYAHAGIAASKELDAAFVDVCAGDTAWIASVASPATTAAIEAALNRRGAHCMHATTRSDCAGVQIAYAQPSRLGVDRFLALLGAHARMPGAALIVSIGTALTIDLLDVNGMHHGGLIAPSPTLMREALTRRASRLPVDGGRVLDFANDTADALASGTILSARALIIRSVRAAQQRLGARPALLIAGGGADAVCDGWRVRFVRTPHIVLHGLQVYAQAVGE
ncbi:MAG: type III pantothenate kinase [Lysobacteraceae bacterium]